MRRSDLRRRIGLCVLAVGLACGAQATLRDYRDVFARLPSEARSRLEQHAAAWTRWSPAERRSQQARLDAWDALPLAERARRRTEYAALQSLTPSERLRVRQAADAFARLPANRRAELQMEFEQLDASAHRGYLLGPDLGRDYPRLQPLLAQVPDAEHTTLLRVLRQMSPTQRDGLATLVQRTPPTDRAALRRELAATTLSNRDTWLWTRLDR